MMSDDEKQAGSRDPDAPREHTFELHSISEVLDFLTTDEERQAKLSSGVRPCAYALCGGQTQGVTDGLCGKCKQVWYCSQPCQKADWERHREDCFNTRYEGATVRPDYFSHRPEIGEAVRMGTEVHNKNMRRKRIGRLMQEVRSKVSRTLHRKHESQARDSGQVHADVVEEFHVLACCALYLGDTLCADQYLGRARKHHDRYLMRNSKPGPSYELFRPGWEKLSMFRNFVCHAIAAANLHARYSPAPTSDSKRDDGLLAMGRYEQKAAAGQPMMSVCEYANVLWVAWKLNELWQKEFKEFRDMSVWMRNVRAALAIGIAEILPCQVEMARVLHILQKMMQHLVLRRLRLPRDPASDWTGWETLEQTCGNPTCPAMWSCVRSFCSGCGCIAYCSSQCQRAHYAEHKDVCNLVRLNGRCVVYCYSDRILQAQQEMDAHENPESNKHMTRLRKQLYSDMRVLEEASLREDFPFGRLAVNWERLQLHLLCCVVNLHEAVPHHNVLLLEEAHTRLNAYALVVVQRENCTFAEVLEYFYRIQSATKALHKLQLETKYWMLEIRISRTKYTMCNCNDFVSLSLFTTIIDLFSNQAAFAEQHDMLCRQFYAEWDMYYQLRKYQLSDYPVDRPEFPVARIQEALSNIDRFFPLMKRLLACFLAKDIARTYITHDLVTDMCTKLVVVQVTGVLPSVMIKMRLLDF